MQAKKLGTVVAAIALTAAFPHGPTGPMTSPSKSSSDSAQAAVPI